MISPAELQACSWSDSAHRCWMCAPATSTPTARSPARSSSPAGKVLFHQSELPGAGRRDRSMTFCQSGLRNTVAASALRRAGFDVIELEGSYAGWARWSAEQAETRPRGEDRLRCAEPCTCKTCGRTTWAGCGQHIEQALAGVPAGERCPGHPDVGAHEGVLRARAGAVTPGLLTPSRPRRARWCRHEPPGSRR